MTVYFLLGLLIVWNSIVTAIALIAYMREVDTHIMMREHLGEHEFKDAIHTHALGSAEKTPGIP